MKILLSADWFYPAQMGGPANVIYWQAKALTRAGHEVTVVATSQDLPLSVPLDRWKMLDCGRVIYTKNLHFYIPVSHIWQGWRAIQRADVVHVNSLFYPSSVVFVLRARWLGKRVIWSPHGELNPNALVYSSLCKKLTLWLFRQISGRVTFHATCPAEAEHIRQHFGPDVAVGEIVNRMELPPVIERTARPYLLFIGRLHPIKAIDRLLDALSASDLFRQSLYTLTIAGPDSSGYGKTLVERARVLGLTDKVDFIGAVQGARKEQLYADALVTVLPSHSENFGNVVMESLAQGTPVITSTGTPWQRLETEGAGSWVANDPDALRQAVETYLTMPAETYRTYRQRATKLARQFDIFAHVGQWERFYEARPTLIGPTDRVADLRKLVRFAGIYGWQRALNKAVARTRVAAPWWELHNALVAGRPADVSVIGCGQFAFSAICFFLRKANENRFLSAFDTDRQQAESLGRCYRFRQIADTPEAVLDNPALKTLYIVSNHASHTAYAVAGLLRNVDVYVEKPVSVTRAQLVALLVALRQSSGRLYAGYNRPYARAIRLLRERVTSAGDGAFSISYVINGHRILPDHWYRQPDEGTRICGNLSHWIDLTIHLFAWRGLPGWVDVQIACANPAEPDDNLTVTFTTDRHDIVTMLLTSRSEPFEGISESINFQYNDLIARIDDFRRMTVWQGVSKQRWQFSPKDVGHERAVLQPFRTDNRDWREVELSTLLMLFIRDMVLNRRMSARFEFDRELLRLATDVQRNLLPLPTVTP